MRPALTDDAADQRRELNTRRSAMDMTKVDIKELIGDAREVFNARRVIGEPYEKNGITVIPVVAIGGGGGGGGGGGSEEGKAQGSGGGGGFGMGARPVGAYVIRGDDARWVPAVDFT